MKNIPLHLLVFCILIFASLSTLQVKAQEEFDAGTAAIELNDNGAQGDKVDDVSILSLIGFIVVAISVPFVISFIIQILTENTLTAYICTYCILVLLYYLVSLFVTDMSGSRNIMTYVFLMLPSMFGSLFAQFAYFMLLVKEAKRNSDSTPI